MTTYSPDDDELAVPRDAEVCDGGARNSERKRGERDAELAAYAARKITRITAETVGRAGGVYVPPHKLQELQASIKEGTLEYQRLTWEALKKSINTTVNRVNLSNISDVVVELFKLNLLRGRGLFARAVIRAQLTSPGFTPTYAALVAVVNSKVPDIGLLIVHRVIHQFRRAYRRNDKIVAVACVKFIAHLVNQRVVDYLLVLQLAALLLEKLTDDSVEVCIRMVQEVGQFLVEASPKGLQAITERLRHILQEGVVEKRAQYVLERLFDDVRRQFADFPAVVPELDLLEEEDQVTHSVDLLQDALQLHEDWDIFQPLEWQNYEDQERTWNRLGREIIGDDAFGGGAAAADGGDDAESSVDSEAEDVPAASTGPADRPTAQAIKDLTEAELVSLRKAIYLTVVSSASADESVHKLMKMNIRPGCEIEVATMIIDCCAQERSFQRFYSLQATLLCGLRRVYRDCFARCFEVQYGTVHRLDTNKLRNVAKLFAHLFYAQALSWECCKCLVLSEEATTSASRIFIKVLMQELSEQMGVRELFNVLHDSPHAPALAVLFPTDSLKAMRFSINFFTAIGLGALADPLREQLADTLEQMAAEG